MSDPVSVTSAAETLNWDFWNYFANPYFWSGFMGWCQSVFLEWLHGMVRSADD